MSDKLQAVLDETVATGAAPFVIAMTGNHAGITWTGVAGDCAPGKPAALDTLFGLYSMTKAVCATAATILIDRGQLDLDTPAADTLPEIGALQVLEGFDGDAARLRAAGSCYRAGGANSHYWIDFRNDLDGPSATYDAPFLDPPFMAKFATFERTVYARAGLS